MSRTVKKQPTIHKRLFLIACLLIAFLLGLLVALLQPGAIVALLVIVGLIVLIILGESFYLWRLAKLKEINKGLNKRSRVKPLPGKESAQ